MRLPAIAALVLAACSPRPAARPPAEVAKLFEGCVARRDEALLLVACGSDALVELRPIRREGKEAEAFLTGLQKGYGGDWITGVGPGRALRRVVQPPEAPAGSVAIDAVFAAPDGPLRELAPWVNVHAQGPAASETRLRGIVDEIASRGLPAGLSAPR